MPKSVPQTENAKIAVAALHLAAVKGWPQVTLEAVARKTKIPIAKLKKRFTMTRDIVPVMVDEITRRTHEISKKPSGTLHDVLFDLMMARFDILQNNRKAILSVANGARRDPRLMRIFAYALSESLYSMIVAAKLNMFPKALMKAGLVGVYARGFSVWEKDMTRDMSKTMAALDQALRFLEKAMGLVKRNSSRATTSAHAPVLPLRPTTRARTH
jgi:hypothetical protein